MDRPVGRDLTLDSIEEADEFEAAVTRHSARRSPRSPQLPVLSSAQHHRYLLSHGSHIPSHGPVLQIPKRL
jgi:hypothetical protein